MFQLRSGCGSCPAFGGSLPLLGTPAFDGLKLERAALTSLVVKSGQVSLVTSSVRSIRLRLRFTPRYSLVRFNELTDLYIFMKALAF